MLETLNQHKILLTAVPVISYIIFIMYSFLRHIPTGFATLFLGLFGIPSMIIGQVVLYFILKLAGEKSLVPAGVLAIVAAFSIISTLIKMLFFNKVKVNTTQSVVVTPKITTPKAS